MLYGWTRKSAKPLANNFRAVAYKIYLLQTYQHYQTSERWIHKIEVFIITGTLLAVEAKNICSNKTTMNENDEKKAQPAA